MVSVEQTFHLLKRALELHSQSMSLNRVEANIQLRMTFLMVVCRAFLTYATFAVCRLIFCGYTLIRALFYAQGFLMIISWCTMMLLKYHC